MTADDHQQRHDPTILRTSQFGTWVLCSCGWKSSNGTPSLAQNEFGQHLVSEQGAQP
jgi:hypothetical protein